MSRLSWLRWTLVVPLLADLVLAVTWGRHDLVPAVVAIVALVLAAAVLAAVHHAEVVAHRVGEPFGSLVLAVAVTVIEVGLITTLMASGKDTGTLARDTVFAAVMISTTGIVGVCLFVGAVRHHIVAFNAEGAGAALATVTTLAVLTMVLPTFTTSAQGKQFAPPQLAFAAIVSLVLYVIFVLNQTTRHRDFFLPVRTGDEDEATEVHAEPPSVRVAMTSVGLLLLSLVAVVGLAKVESPSIEHGVAAVGFPDSFVGVVIALLVLLPEGLSAVRSARRNHLQISLNLALGSAIASIGLTIPTIALASIWLPGPLILGLGGTQIVLLAVTVLVTVLTVVPGRATRVQGGVHLVIFATFLFLAIKP